MHPLLENDKKSISSIFNATVQMAEDFLNHQESLPPGRFVKYLSFENLPVQGKGALQTLADFKEKYTPLLCNSAGPRYFGFVTGGSTPASNWQTELSDIELAFEVLEKFALRLLTEINELH